MSDQQQITAEAYIRRLADRGIDYVFANAGTDFAPIIEAISRNAGSDRKIPKFITVPHENLAMAMAHGYYQVAGKPAGVMVHVTVGTGNTICALMNAARDNVPLLLMAGLSLVPEDLLKAAKVDGATAWQRFWRIMVPLMKPAILVALLFRTLDAFRIFDNIFILTNGANNTSSVSMLNYDNLFTGFNFGIGSAMSILILICVAIIAFIFIRGFGTAAPGSSLQR